LEFLTIFAAFFLIFVIVVLILGIKIVPQSENWIVEKLGKYDRTFSAGLHLIIPYLERIQYKVSIQETQLPPDPINAITHDNVPITIELAILYRIVDLSKTVYRIQNLELGIKTIINGTVRSVIGKTDLDGVQSNRRHIADEIELQLQHVADEWGIKLTRVEITEVEVDEATKEAMQIQLNAERKRRGIVTEAEGAKQSTQLQADAMLYKAQREAEAKRITAEAEAFSVNVVANAILNGGASAVDFEIKKIQASAIQEIGKSGSSKIILIPSDVLSGLTGSLSNLVNKIK